MQCICTCKTVLVIVLYKCSSICIIMNLIINLIEVLVHFFSFFKLFLLGGIWRVVKSKSYRITVFFCGCKFLRFVSKIGTCNFCDFIFCDFTPWHSDFYSFEKKTSCQPDTPRFLSWACAFNLKLNSFSALLNTSIDHPRRNTCVLFLWTKANWCRNYPSRWFTLVLIRIT